MSNENICLFVPKEETSISDNISILNIVYEKHPETIYQQFRIRGCYTFNVVVKGTGKLNTLSKSYNIKENDFFITYPSSSHKIETNGDLEFIYISFIGSLLLSIGSKLAINKNNPVFHLKDDELKQNYEHIINNANNVNNYFLIISTIYLTLSKLSEIDKISKHTESSIALYMKNYIEDHYAEHDLKLEKLVDKINYHPNYLSAIFKKEFNTTFSAYLQNLRLSNSLHLINNGLTSVKEIATLCGFNDSLYFSRVFKKAYGKSPKCIIKNKNNLCKKQ